MMAFKNILARIFALWAMIMFVLSLLVMYVPFLITGTKKDPARSISLHRNFVVWMKFFFVVTGVKRIFRGEENFIPGENYIVVCNHNSMMDVPLTSPGIPGPNKTIAKEEMSRMPLFGMIYKYGSVLVNRKSEESRRNSYAKMKEVLQMGLHMCIYPEGTRNKSAELLQPFHDGAFKLAAETQKSIMPAAIFYTDKVLPRKFFYFWPHKVEMHFLPPVSPGSKTVRELKQQVYQIMKDYIIKHQ